LSELDIEDFLDLRVVSCDVEDDLRSVLQTGDVDRNKVFADLCPLDSAGTRSGDVKNLGPQAADWNASFVSGAALLSPWVVGTVEPVALDLEGSTGAGQLVAHLL